MFFVFMFFGQIKTHTHFDFYNNIYSITFFTTVDKANTRLGWFNPTLSES